MIDRPNLLFILSDQQRADTIACYGADWVCSPALNSLSDKSFVFENAYVTQPVCTPARATLLTGLYPHSAGMVKNNVVLDPAIKTIAEMLPDDYLCAYYGKWHLGRETTPQHGFTDWLPLAELPWTTDHPDTPYHQFLLENGVRPDTVTAAGQRVFSPKLRVSLPEHLTMARFLAEKASEFLQRQFSQPFMLQVHFFEPHNPYTGPLNDLHNPAEIPVGPAFMKPPQGVSLLDRVRAEFYMQPEGPHTKMGSFNGGSSEDRWRSLRAQYYGNVALVDRAVGKILDALQRSGQADNTIVVFSADHGEMVGDHGLLEKRTFYEESARVPLLLRVPWLSKAQRKIRGNIGHIDLVPTLLDLMGQPMPDHLQGRSRTPVLRGEDTLDENDVFVQWNGVGDRDIGSRKANLLNNLQRRSIVTSEAMQGGGLQRWKLNLCQGDQCELFDLLNDPHELTNLFDEPSQRDRVREMAAKIRLWQHETGDTAPLPSV